MTHSAQHADTTDATTNFPTAGGDTWAYDNMALKYVVTPQGKTSDGLNRYDVMINATGSFNAFANSRDGSAYTGTGSVKGWIDYVVTSSKTPNPASVPAQELPGSSIRAGITQLLPDATIVGGGAYSFTYNQVAGSPYTQSYMPAG